MALLRCNEAQVDLIAAFRSSALLKMVMVMVKMIEDGVSHLPLDNTPKILNGVQVRRVCWPIKYSNTMVMNVVLAVWAGAKSCWKMKSASP